LTVDQLITTVNAESKVETKSGMWSGRRSLAFVTLLGAVSLSGCFGFLGGGGTSPDYRITANRNTYQRGNTGEVTVKNVSDKTVEYNLCQRRLERQENKYWIVAYQWPTSGGACTTEIRRLGKGESVNTLFDIPTGVPTGRYRVIFTGLRDADGKMLSSDAAATQVFDVR
jgi:hypothetical protein